MTIQRDSRNTSQIRSYQDTDLADLLTVWQSASQLAHSFLTQSFIAQEKINIPQLYIPNADTWVLEVDGQFVGFTALLGNEIGALFVAPSQQRSGYGKALLDKARQLHPSLEVEVFKQNPIGRSFYDKNGFTLIEEKFHQASGQPVLRLQLAA